MQNETNKFVFVGLRAEDKSKWERRVVLTPTHVQQLLEKNSNLKIIVQPSRKRIFRDVEYEKVGAIVSEDLSRCSLILGVKEVPKEKLLPDRTYVYFSHVIKAQEYNMPMLDVILAKKIRLIDYEKIADDRGKRLVAFGKFAGNAGAIDFLSGIGKYLMNLEYTTPFLNVASTYVYPSLEKAKVALKEIGNSIINNGIPEEYAPLIFGVTGKGRCSDGVTEILECFPIKIVDPDELQEIMKNREDLIHLTQIYVTYFEAAHMVKSKDPTKQFDKLHYYENPQLYEPKFHEEYLPYISVLYHCMYWEKKYPRLITNDQIKELALQKNLRLFGICDVTCDFEGSIQFLTEFTNIDKPFYLYNPITGEKSYDTTSPTTNILYQAVDFLPTELAVDASAYFSNKLLPFIENITFSKIEKPLDEQELLPQIKRAVIAWNGQLTPSYTYINELRALNEFTKKKRGNQVGESSQIQVQPSTHFSLKGRVFDTKQLNKIYNVLDSLNLKYRELEINIEESDSDKTVMSIQILTKDVEKCNQAIKDIYNIGEILISLNI